MSNTVDTIKDLLKEQMQLAKTTNEQQLVALCTTATLLARVVDELLEIKAKGNSRRFRVCPRCQGQ